MITGVREEKSWICSTRAICKKSFFYLDLFRKHLLVCRGWWWFKKSTAYACFIFIYFLLFFHFLSLLLLCCNF